MFGGGCKCRLTPNDGSRESERRTETQGLYWFRLSPQSSVVLIVVLLRRVTTGVLVSLEKRGSALLQLRVGHYRGDLFSTRERVCEIDSSESSCVFSIGSCVDVLLVWRIVSLVRHTAPCNQSVADISIVVRGRVPQVSPTERSYVARFCLSSRAYVTPWRAQAYTPVWCTCCVLSSIRVIVETLTLRPLRPTLTGPTSQ